MQENEEIEEEAELQAVGARGVRIADVQRLKKQSPTGNGES
jgi:hypothetical protein